MSARKIGRRHVRRSADDADLAGKAGVRHRLFQLLAIAGAALVVAGEEDQGNRRGPRPSIRRGLDDRQVALDAGQPSGQQEAACAGPASIPSPGATRRSGRSDPRRG